MEEGGRGDQSIVYGFHGLLRGPPIFEDRDGNRPGIYAAFDATQMKFYADFWETSPSHLRETSVAADGDGPDGEVYMAVKELEIYLGYHAVWT